MLQPRFLVYSLIGDGISQIKLTEFQTMHQNAYIGGTCMLATQVCVWPSRFECERRGEREC